jgi:hypothetical protein
MIPDKTNFDTNYLRFMRINQIILPWLESIIGIIFRMKIGEEHTDGKSFKDVETLLNSV